MGHSAKDNKHLECREWTLALSGSQEAQHSALHMEEAPDIIKHLLYIIHYADDFTCINSLSPHHDPLPHPELGLLIVCVLQMNKQAPSWERERSYVAA